MHASRSVLRWDDVPAEVRRGLEPVVPGDAYPIVEVQLFAKDVMTADHRGRPVLRCKSTAWSLVWRAWQVDDSERPWPEKNPWRKHHTRNYWVWFRRDGPFTNNGLRFTIETDGRVVWVNSERGLIGRFNRDGGVDVHNVPGTPTTCEDCFPEPDWERFKASMLRAHNVVVGDKYKPKEA